MMYCCMCIMIAIHRIHIELQHIHSYKCIVSIRPRRQKQNASYSGLRFFAKEDYLCWAFLQTRTNEEKRSRGKTEKGARPQSTHWCHDFICTWCDSFILQVDVTYSYMPRLIQTCQHVSLTALAHSHIVNAMTHSCKSYDLRTCAEFFFYLIRVPWVTYVFWLSVSIREVASILWTHIREFLYILHLFHFTDFLKNIY